MGKTLRSALVLDMADLVKAALALLWAFICVKEKMTEQGFRQQSLQAWLNKCWWLTAVPQQLSRFRESNLDITLYLVWQGDKAVFYEKTERSELIPRELIQNIQRAKPMIDKSRFKLWLERNYESSLRQLNEDDNDEKSKGTYDEN